MEAAVQAAAGDRLEGSGQVGWKAGIRFAPILWTQTTLSPNHKVHQTAQTTLTLQRVLHATALYLARLVRQFRQDQVLRPR